MKNENGLVFVSVTVTIALFIVLGFGLVAIAGNDLFWVDRQRSSAQAFAIAEGGLAVAMAEIERNPNWRPGSESFDLGNGSYRLSIEDLGSGRYLLVSEGTVRGVTERVSMDFRSMAFGFDYHGNIGVGGLIVPTQRQITFAGDSWVNGDIRLGGQSKIDTPGNTVIDIYYTGINYTGADKWGNTAYLRKVPQISWSRPSLEHYQSQSHVVLESGVLTPSDNRPMNLNGRLYIREGDLSIHGTFTGTGVIVVSGKITVTDNIKMKDDQGHLLLISLSDIYLTAKGANQVGASLIAYNTLKWEGNAKVDGSISAEHLEWGGDMTAGKWSGEAIGVFGDLVGEGFSWGSWSEGN